jgi:hypothetical protein
MYQILRTTVGRWLHSPRDQVLLAATLTYLLVLETIGRQVQGPVAVVDLFLCAALAVGGAWLLAAHGRSPISWVSGVTRGFQRLYLGALKHTFRIGLDLRRSPAIPRRVPPLLLLSVAGCEFLTLCALAWDLWQPIPARDLVGSVSRVGFAAAQFVLWSALLFVICGVLFAAPALMRDLYVCRQMTIPRERRRRIQSGWFFVLFVTLSMAGISLLPVSAATLILAGSFLAGNLGIWLPPRREFDFIWQPRGRAVVYSMSWRTYVSLLNSTSILFCLVLMLLSVGPAAVVLAEPAEDLLSVTRALGTVASWIVAVGAVVILWPMAIMELIMKWRDPAVPCPTRVRVDGELAHTERQRIRDILHRQGWVVRFGGRERSVLDVPVTVRNDASDAIGWPRTVSLDEFNDEGLLWSIARRDQIQKRRVFLRTLQSILKQARRRRYEKSTGFWIAPHYWFILGLTRDTAERSADEDQTTLLEVIPPLYHQAFPRAVRRHFLEVCRGVEIDLIFLEDGVQWHELRRVLRMLFEHYDVHGGRRRIEELHFRGVPRVRVIIHEFELGADWQRGQYPEPDFEDLARARVLHVFRDRGDEEVPLETPLDWDRMPSPVPAGSLPS